MQSCARRHLGLFQIHDTTHYNHELMRIPGNSGLDSALFVQVFSTLLLR